MSDEEITDADPDTEATLREMKELKELIDRSEKRYKDLREQIVEDFEGPRYFMTASGQKLYAFKVQNTKLIVDEGLLADELPADQLAKLYKQVFDEDAYKAEVASGRIPVALFKRATKKVNKGAPYLRYGDPEKPARE